MRIYAIFLIIVVLAYLPLFNNYFMHDEWGSFLYYYDIFSKHNLLDAWLGFFQPQPGQYIPMPEVINYSIFYIFGLNFFVYLMVGLSLHSLVGVLVYKLLDQITKSKLIAFICGLAFILAPHHFQATSWVLANIGYSLSAIFLLLGLINYFSWLESDDRKKLVLAAVVFLLSVLSKDITLFIIPALPAITLIYLMRSDRKIFLSCLSVLPAAIFGLWHLWFIRTHPLAIFLAGSLPSTLNILYLPIRAITQSILPQPFIYFLAKILLYPFPPYVSDKINTTAFNLQVESQGAAAVITILFLAVLFLGRMIYKKFANGFKLFLSGVFLAGMSGLPYIFVDPAQFSLLQPRYVYIGVICLTLSLAAVLKICLNKWGNKTLLVVGVVLGVFIVSTWVMSYRLAETGSQRRQILEQVNSWIIPTNNIVIYAYSNKSYYGLPDRVKILPFQVNFGKVLAASSFQKVYLPRQMYSYFTLEELDDQGYYFDNQGSFGYFWDFNKLQESVSKNKIIKSSVYAFYFDSKQQKLINKTEQVREALRFTDDG